MFELISGRDLIYFFYDSSIQKEVNERIITLLSKRSDRENLIFIKKTIAASIFNYFK